jgi:hypothetical protein
MVSGVFGLGRQGRPTRGHLPDPSSTNYRERQTKLLCLQLPFIHNEMLPNERLPKTSKNFQKLLLNIYGFKVLLIKSYDKAVCRMALNLKMMGYCTMKF